MMFLLGRQAMLGQEPPMYLRSTVATRCPCSAKVQARNFDPVPLPRITRSYSSGSVVFGSPAEETVSILFICIFPSRPMICHDGFQPSLKRQCALRRRRSEERRV